MPISSCARTISQLGQVFESFGCRGHGQTEAFVKLDSPDTESLWLPVDIMLVSRETFLKLADGRRELEFGPTRLGVPQPLPLIALKLHAMKNDARRRLGKDLPDNLQLIRLYGIDRASVEFRRIVDRYANQPTIAPPCCRH